MAWRQTDEFPIGGPRQAVYDALASRQFAIGGFGDKHWKRLDGLEAHIYGAGSQLQVRRGDEVLTDGPMAESLNFIDQLTAEAT